MARLQYVLLIGYVLDGSLVSGRLVTGELPNRPPVHGDGPPSQRLAWPADQSLRDRFKYAFWKISRDEIDESWQLDINR